MRKLIVLVVVFMFISNNLLAQGTKYDRNTITILQVKHGDGFDAVFENSLLKIPREDKYNYNDINQASITSPIPRNARVSSVTKDTILSILNREDIGKREVATWYMRKPDGTMNMRLIHSRGEFNATDENYINAIASKRGVEELKDMGRAMINNTYVLVYDYTNLKYSSNTNTDVHSYQSDVWVYIFKIDYNEEIEGMLYDCWIYEDDLPEVIEHKKKSFDKLKINLQFVMSLSQKMSVSGRITGKRVESSSNNQNTATTLLNMIGDLAQTKMSKEEMLYSLVMSGNSNLMTKIEDKVSSFESRASVYEVDPIRAKVGRKEGLYFDQRYKVYEYEQGRNGDIKEVRKGVVRASKIVDNRKVADGKSETSEFYQIAGGEVEPGMTLRQSNDLGMSIIAGYGYGGQSQFKGRLEYLISKGFIPIKSLYIYGEVDFESRGYSRDSLQIANDLTLPSEDDNKKYSFLRYGVGLGKGFQLNRNTQISPYIGVGWESVSSYASNTSVETMYFKGGVNLTLNLYYPLQLVGGAHVFFYTSPKITRDDSSDTEIYSLKYRDIFNGRDNMGISLFVGLKLNF